METRYRAATLQLVMSLLLATALAVSAERQLATEARKLRESAEDFFKAVGTVHRLLAANGGKAQTCASLQPKFCRSKCTNDCAASSDPGCFGSCNSCCMAFNPDVASDYECKNAPQCKNWLDLRLGPKYENKGCGKQQVDACRTGCQVVCDKSYPAANDAAANSACVNSCAPCCKGMVSKTCSSSTAPRGDIAVDYYGVWQQCTKFDSEYPAASQSFKDTIFPKPVDECFPSSSTAQLESGASVRMDQLRIGDRVAVMTHDGRVAYEDVYMFAHQDPTSDSKYVVLSVRHMAGDAKGNGSAPDAWTASLTLSGRHMAPTLASGGGGALAAGACGDAIITAECVASLELTPARDIQPGDVLLLADPRKPGSLARGVVTSKLAIRAMGAYNPHTLSGRIIVDGVVASSENHPDAWQLGLSPRVRWLMPVLYNVYRALCRAGYRVAGPRVWAHVNALVDTNTLQRIVLRAFEYTFGSPAMASQPAPAELLAGLTATASAR